MVLVKLQIYEFMEQQKQLLFQRAYNEGLRLFFLAVSISTGYYFALQANQSFFTYLAPLMFDYLRPP